MNWIFIIGVVGVAVFFFLLDWTLTGLEQRVKELERRMEGK